jgi:hypothetical protein
MAKEMDVRKMGGSPLFERDRSKSDSASLELKKEESRK